MEQTKNIADRLMIYGFYCLMFCIPFATTPAVIAEIFIFAVWLFSGMVIKRHDMWLRAEWTIPVTMIVVLPWIALLYTNDLENGFHFAGKSQYWVLAFAGASLFVAKEEARNMLKAFIAGLSLNSVISVLQYFGAVPMEKGMPIGFFGWHITYSLMLVFGILMLSSFYPKAEGWKKKSAIAGLCLLFFAVLSVVPGRIGYVAFIAMFPFALVNIIGRKRTLAVIALSVVAGAALYFSPVVQERTDKAVREIRSYLRKGNIDTSIGRRFHMWEGAVKLFAEHPIIGVGPGDYKDEMNRYDPEGTVPDIDQPHNSFLYMAVGFGIVGLVPLIWVLFILLKNGFRRRGSPFGFAIFSIACIATIGSLTDTQIGQAQTAMLFAVFMGLQGAKDE